MTYRWREVWQRRGQSLPDEILLETLIELDGFDSGAGKVDVADWRQNAEFIIEHLALTNGDSIFEVGCGAGAFLFAIEEKLDVHVGGLDFAPNLVKVASHVMPKGTFISGDALELELSPQYDFVVAHAVFHYLSRTQAYTVLERMHAKARKAVCILEVPDLATQELSEFQDFALPLSFFRTQLNRNSRCRELGIVLGNISQVRSTFRANIKDEVNE